jgi:ornithine--oxo-acid transaminase
MTKSEALIKKVEQYGAHNYHPLAPVLSRGKGAKVWDVDGKEYLDFLACYSALNFGHQHPRLVKALVTQLDRLAVCSRAFYSELLCEFSEKLAKFCGLDSVLPMNSGTEAVETALKIARKWGYEKKKVAAGRGEIVAMKDCFHGRTIAVISFSTEESYRAGFGPFVPGFPVVPFGDLDALGKAINENTIGVILEPIQAEAGILLPPVGYMKQVRALCDKHNVLMIVDEIQTGMARTGKNFCYEHEGAKPDILILGKSLGGGLLPVSAVVARKEVMDVIRPGQHGSTFGGNPLGCAVAMETLDLMVEEKFAQKAAALGELAMAGFNATKLPKVKEIRGKGALIGIELDPSAGGARRYTERLAEVGVLCKETHDNVIRIAPPLVITESELKVGIDKIASVIKELA